MKEATVGGMYNDPMYIAAMEELQRYDHEMLGELWREEYNDDEYEVFREADTGNEKATIKW